VNGEAHFWGIGGNSKLTVVERLKFSISVTAFMQRIIHKKNKVWLASGRKRISSKKQKMEEGPDFMITNSLE
jgi:hypothetical protein